MEDEAVGPTLGRARRAVVRNKRYVDGESEDEEEQQEEVAEVAVTNDEPSETGTPKKRGRGRPRKDGTVSVKKERDAVDDSNTDSNPTYKTTADRVREDVDLVKDTITAIPSSSLQTLLAPIFERLGPEQQLKQLDALLQLHVNTYKDTMPKKVPRDFIKQSVGAMDVLMKGQVDLVPYYMSKALATNILPVQTASFAMLQVIVMSLFSNRLEDFFSQPHAGVFSDWLETACGMFPAPLFLDHLNSVLFPLTNMQFAQTSTDDSAQLCIVLEILAHMSEEAEEDTAEADTVESTAEATTQHDDATLASVLAPQDAESATLTQATFSELQEDAVGILDPATGNFKPYREIPASKLEERLLEKRPRKRRRLTAPGEVPLNVDGKVFCEECDISFRENRNYFKHMEQHDGLKQHGCPFCEKAFDLKRVLFNHIIDLHCKEENGEYKCGWCSTVNSSELTESFRNHIRHHIADKLQCEFCDRCFHAKGYLTEHIELQHNGPPYKCQHCPDFEFPKKDEYKNHMKEQHKPGLMCRVCGKKSSNRKEQQEHFKEHSAEDLAAAGIKSKAVASMVKEVIDNEKEAKRKQKEQEKEAKMQCLIKNEESGEPRSSSDSASELILAAATAAPVSMINDAIDTSDPSCRLRAKPYLCVYCNKGFTKQEVLKRHMARHLGEDLEYKCRFCDSHFKSQKDSRNHELKTHCLREDGAYQCQWCPKFFREPVKLRSHEWLHTKESEFQCQYCSHRCKSRSILIRHENTHLGIRPHQCSDCGQTFALKHSLNEHIMVHKGIKPYQCDKCPEKRYVSKAQLKSHILRIHKGLSKSFSCRECGKGFTAKTSLQIHMRIHTGEKPYPCKTCGKAFSNRTAMKRHEMVMHSAGDGPHVCPYCEKIFAYKYAMYYHRKLVHETEPKLQCSYCEKKFRRRQEVQMHELVHTGVKQFRCKECGKCFRTKSQMQEHETIHRGLPRFSCPYCDKAFIHRSSYKRHVLLHKGILPYECPHCDKAFPDRSNMISHIKHIHKDEATDLSSLPAPKVKYAPARLPQELRKYPKSRSLETIETDTSGTIEFQIIKQDPEESNAAAEGLSQEVLHTLLENSGQEQMNFMLTESGEYVVADPNMKVEYENAVYETVSHDEIGNTDGMVIHQDDGSGNVTVMSVDQQTYDTVQQIEQQIEQQEQEQEGDLDAPIEFQILETTEGGGEEQQLQEAAAAAGMENENVKFVEVVDENGDRQYVCVPYGVNAIQVGDQLIHIPMDGEGEGGGGEMEGIEQQEVQ